MITENMIRDMDLAFINKDGVREQINPAIILKLINGEELDSNLQKDLNQLKDARPELFITEKISVEEEQTVFIPKWMEDENDPDIKRKVMVEKKIKVIVEKEVPLDLKPLIIAAHEQVKLDEINKKAEQIAKREISIAKLAALGLDIEDLKNLGL